MSVYDDVVVVGAGPVGCVAACAFAARGARVTLVEANPGTKVRFAGELLHPAAVRVLQRHGLAPLPPAVDHPAVRGFAVVAEGGRATCLDYPDGHTGWTFPFEAFVHALRERTVDRPGIDWRPGLRVLGLVDGGVEVETPGGSSVLRAGLVVGADGRFSQVRRALGAEPRKLLLSHMAGLTLRGVELPHEGYGHVVLAPVGPLLAYRIAPDVVRVCVDVPAAWRGAPDRLERVRDAYLPHLPDALRAPVAAALTGGEVQWALNEVSPRTFFGRPGVALVGDAVGHSHPMTACGMLLGFEDADALARLGDVDAYAEERRRAGAAPATLATALYEIFALDDRATDALRQAIFDLWRDPATASRTMGFLGGLDVDPWSLLSVGARMVRGAAGHVARDAWRERELGEALVAWRRLVVLASWLARDALSVPSAALPGVVLPPTPFAEVRAARATEVTARAA